MNKEYQENRGKRWSPEEDMYLIQQVNYLSHSDIGKHLRRSENAIISRLKKLAFHMIQNGEDQNNVQLKLRLSEEDMESINNEFFLFPRKPIANKFITSIKKPSKKGYFSPPQYTQEIQLLLEIRSMLRKLLSIHHQDPPSEYPSYRSNLNQNPDKQIRIYDLNLDELEKRSEEFAKLSQV
jgi:hypothetical protein